VHLHGTGTLGSVVVKLRPWAAANLFRLGMHELAGCHTDLRNILSAALVTHIEEQLAEAHDAEQRVALVRTWLQRLLQERDNDALVALAFHHIGSVGGAVRTAELARQLGMSERQLERRFLAWVGMSPKAVARVVRLQRTLSHYHAGMSWAAIAAEAGFSDQAHLVREFRTMTGTTPARFLTAESGNGLDGLAPTLHASTFFNRAIG
jgi:AraC-like DNA-binding protein